MSFLSTSTQITYIKHLQINYSLTTVRLITTGVFPVLLSTFNW